MMKLSFFQVAVLVTFLISLGGCAKYPTIQKTSQTISPFDDSMFDSQTTIIDDSIDEEDTYRVFRQAATGYISVETTRQNALKAASDFCDSYGKKAVLRSETKSVPPHILGNFPRVELIFACVSTRQTMEETYNIDKYEQLEKLKNLLDKKILTQQEFEAEKAKILSR